MERNPGISERTPQSLAKERAVVSENDIKEWMAEAKTTLEVEAPEALKDKRRCFNGDEVGYPLDVVSKRVLARTGQKQVYQRASGKHEQITVFACGNAAGEFMPPRLVFPGQRMRDIGVGGFTEADYSMSDKGWMDSETFLACLSSLVSFCNEKVIERPVILFVDGYSAHCSLEAARYCAMNDIHLYCLIPHASHLTQPLDVGVFGPMQSKWKEALVNFQIQNPNSQPTKYIFPQVFKPVWEDPAKSANLAAGFKAAGIFPLNGNILIDRIVKSREERERAVEDLAAGNIPNLEDTPAPAPVQAPPSMPTPVNAEVRVLPPPPPLEQTPLMIQHMSPAPAQLPARRTLPLFPNTINIQANTQSTQPKPSTYTPLAAKYATTSTSTSASGPSAPFKPPFKRSVYISPALQSNLQVPEVSVKRKAKAVIPKHISGQRCLAYLESKRKQKEEMEKAKVERMHARMEKKKEKEIKEREKAEKRKQKQEEMKRKGAEKNKGVKRRKSRKPVKTVVESESDSTSEVEIIYNDSDDSDDLNMDVNISSALCPKCGKGEEEELGLMVACVTCPRWWHLACSGDPDMMDMEEDEIEEYPFTCLYCEV